MAGQWMEREVLIVVKAYPNPSEKYHETVCVAAISREEGFLRLHPVQFRSLPPSQQFQKYQRVRLRLRKHERDRRDESFRPDQDSIQLLEVKKKWSERWEWMEPVLNSSMCEIQDFQRESGKSLGLFKPAQVIDFIAQPIDSEWAGKKQDLINQMTLFDPIHTKLEKIPFVFRYRYRCNAPACNGHTQSIIDWELMELYRKLRRTEPSESRILEKLRAKFFDELCGSDKDTYFIVGNHSQYPKSFMVIGVFWPPRIRGGLFA